MWLVSALAFHEVCHMSLHLLLWCLHPNLEIDCSLTNNYGSTPWWFCVGDYFIHCCSPRSTVSLIEPKNKLSISSVTSWTCLVLHLTAKWPILWHLLLCLLLGIDLLYGCVRTCHTFFCQWLVREKAMAKFIQLSANEVITDWSCDFSLSHTSMWLTDSHGHGLPSALDISIGCIVKWHRSWWECAWWEFFCDEEPRKWSNFWLFFILFNCSMPPEVKWKSAAVCWLQVPEQENTRWSPSNSEDPGDSGEPGPITRASRARKSWPWTA